MAAQPNSNNDHERLAPTGPSAPPETETPLHLVAGWDGTDAAATEEARLAEARYVWEGTDIPQWYRKFRPLSASPRRDTMPDVINRLRCPEYDGDDAVWQAAYAAWWGSLFLWGDVGRGKTGIAVGYARDAVFGLGWPPSVWFRTVPKLLTDLRDTYNRGGQTEAAVLRRAQTVDLLILDDLGTEAITDWGRDRLYQVIGERHDEERATVITSNLTLEELEAPTQLGPRLAWRIAEMCGPHRVIQVIGDNLRER